MSQQIKLGKLSFKKTQKLLPGQGKKQVTTSQKTHFLEKRKQQDFEILDEDDKAKAEIKANELPNEEVQNILLKEKEENLNPQEIIKKIKIGKTPAQISYDMIKMKRIEEQIEKKLHLTYREKIDNFNSQIARMPEHYDIPKVGPG